MILALFSASYPYDTATDQTFLKVEIQHLAAAFEKVVLVPRNCKGQRLPVPGNVIVVDGYCSFLKNPLKISLVPKILTSNIFYRDLAMRPWTLVQPRTFFRLITFLAGAYLTETWVTRWIEEQDLDIHDCVFYTYWFDQAAMGIGIAKHTYPDLKLVSRAHGYDIYEDLYFPFYWPCRQQALSTLDKLFPASDDGANYFRKKYPHFASIVESAHLGVKGPGFQSNPSTDNVFRIVSCAHIVSLKRIDLLLKGIALAAHQRPDQKFEWIHFGGGEIAESFYRSFDVPVTTLRPFNTYGPRQSMRAVIPTIITQALTQNVVKLGSLDPSRDFTFVKDTVNGFMCVAEAENVLGQEVNLGNDNTIRIGDLVNKIFGIIGKTPKVVADSQRIRPGKSEVMKLWASNQKAKELIGWEPRVSLDEGLRLTIEWISAHLDLYRPDQYIV